MTISDHVVPGRCVECGHKLRTWTPRTIVVACQNWNALHGFPPRAHEWTASAPDHPAGKTVSEVFGSWNNMLRASGFVPRNPGAQFKWTKAQIVDALLDWTLVHHRWPVQADWNHASAEHPHAGTVQVIFGTWNAAKRAAGWIGKCNRTRPVPPTPYAPPKCSGCGGDLDNQTDGCRTCWRRHDNDARRAPVAA